MAQFYTLLTQVGQAKLANAVALGNTIELTHLAVGDGGGSVPTPDSDRTALINEVRRAPINRVEVDADNPNWIVVEQVMPPDVGGWTIREIGVLDSAGDLIAYGNYPETYKPTLDEGSGRTQTVRMVLQVSDTASVTLKVDPSVVLATRKYADDGDKAVRATTQFASYDADRTYTTSEVVRGSDGQFYEFYDRDQAGTVKGVSPTNSANRPHIWMQWDGVRPGSTIEWRSETLPEGYVENDGSEISRADYRRVFAAHGTTYGAGDGSTTFLLPDDRGEFKRGWDNGRGVDEGRAFGSAQSDQYRSHLHSLIFDPNCPGLGNTSLINTNDSSSSRGILTNHNIYPAFRPRNEMVNSTHAGARTEVSGETETRPRNNAVIYLTKI